MNCYLYLNTNNCKGWKLSDHFWIFWPTLFSMHWFPAPILSRNPALDLWHPLACLHQGSIWKQCTMIPPNPPLSYMWKSCGLTRFTTFRVFLSYYREGGERSPPYGGGLEGGDWVQKGGEWRVIRSRQTNWSIMCLKGVYHIYKRWYKDYWRSFKKEWTL